MLNVVTYDEILEYKDLKVKTYRDKGVVIKFRDWLKQEGFSVKVYLELNHNEDISSNGQLFTYLLVLDNMQNLSALDILESGYEIERTNVRILREDLVGGKGKNLCIYTYDYKRILNIESVKYLILDIGEAIPVG